MTSDPAEPRQRQPRKLDASMTLLNEVMERPLDPAYAQVAARKKAGLDANRSPVNRLTVLVVIILLAAATTIATTTLRAPRPEALRARDLISQQIQERSDTLSQRKTAVAQLRAEIEDLQSSALGTVGQDLLRRGTQLGITTGITPITGPGVRLELSDPPGVDDLDSADRVQDIDLQVVINGLWASGAEAIAVNGHRLTAMAAVRTAGYAILVDFQPLTGPYVVEAVGDPAALEAGMRQTAAGRHLQLLAQTYGIGVSMQQVAQLRLASGTNAVDDAIAIEVPEIGNEFLNTPVPAPSSATNSPGAGN